MTNFHKKSMLICNRRVVWTPTRPETLWRLFETSRVAGTLISCSLPQDSGSSVLSHSRTVIASLHQPRSDIYNMADNFTILVKVCIGAPSVPIKVATDCRLHSQQGNVVFSGPREQLLPHLAFAGYVCPPLYNPSDYCMDLISVDARGRKRQEASTARIKCLVDFWYNRHEKLSELALEDSPAPAPAELQTPLHLEDASERTPMWIALPVVLERTLRNTWRQPDMFWTRYVRDSETASDVADEVLGGHKLRSSPSVISCSTSGSAKERLVVKIA